MNKEKLFEIYLKLMLMFSVLISFSLQYTIVYLIITKVFKAEFSITVKVVTFSVLAALFIFGWALCRASSLMSRAEEQLNNDCVELFAGKEEEK